LGSRHRQAERRHKISLYDVDLHLMLALKSICGF
jgi:hypothetical protein